MLEGTKNEKIILIVLAYIVGLTSGYIGFGIDNNKTTMLESTNTINQPILTDYSLVTNVKYENGQLIVEFPDGPLVLSISVDSLGDIVPELLVNQGHHITPPIYLASPKGRYVYFCEQHLGSENCTNLVFDKKMGVILPVKVNNTQLETSSTMAASAYWAFNGLHIGDYASQSLTEPWLMTPND